MTQVKRKYVKKRIFDVRKRLTAKQEKELREFTEVGKTGFPGKKEFLDELNNLLYRRS